MAKRKHSSIRLALIAAVALLAVILIAGYFVGEWQTSENGPRVSVTYRLKWLQNSGFIGDIYADTYGFYREVGLDVDIQSGGPQRDAIVALVTDNAHFSVASADQVLRALYGGADIVVIAQIYRRNPVNWIYRSKSSTRNSPNDLRGARIGITHGDNDQTIMEAYLKKHNIKDVELLGVQFDYTPFLSGSVDLFPVYINTQGVELQRQLNMEGEPVEFFDPGGPNGINFVANSIVTTSQMVKESGGVVQKFVSATLRGWREALDPDNRDRAVDALALVLKESGAPDDPDFAERTAQQIDATSKLVVPPEDADYGLGAIDLDAWEQTEEIMRNAGLFDLADGTRPPKVDIRGRILTKFTQ